MSITNQRMWDLLRNQRTELLQAGLITEDEYALLVEIPGAIKRLEDYDELRAQVRALAQWKHKDRNSYHDCEGFRAQLALIAKMAGIFL